MLILFNQPMSSLKSAGDMRTSAQACNLCFVQAQTLPYDMNSDPAQEVMHARK
jgi:hypothetical protein